MLSNPLFFLVASNVILPGLGLIYLRKWKSGAAFIISALLFFWARDSGAFINGSYSLFVSLFISFLFMASSIYLSIKFSKSTKEVQTAPKGLVFSIFILNLVVSNFIPKKFEVLKLPTGNMEPTLLRGDHLFVQQTDEIERGDIVAYKPFVGDKTMYLMRVVGLEGERIQVVSDRIKINGKLVNREKLSNWKSIVSEAYQSKNLDLFQIQTGNKSHQILINNARTELSPEVDRTVLDNSFFLLGDNRGHAVDSRYHEDIPRERIYGKVKFIIYNFEKGFFNRLSKLAY